MSRSGLSLFALISVAAISPLFAGSMNIADYNFSNPALASGAFTNQSVPGWTGFSGLSDSFIAFGVYNPVVGTDVASMPGGATQAAFLDASNSEDSSLYQDLSSNGLGNPEVAANTTYTYTVDVGERSNAPFPQSFMQLNAGGTVVGKITDPAPAGPGDWVLETIVWDSASDPSLVGSDLALYFQTDQQSTSAESQILYTNAAVTFTSDAPEPSTYALTWIALIGLALFRRKFLARSN